MKIINASYRIVNPKDLNEDTKNDIYQRIEMAGRTCYKSEAAITPESAAKFVERLINNQHEAMLEHGSMTVIFTVDRGVSHELVRHRVASFAQESTRYCNYGKDKFGSEISVIRPNFFIPQSKRYDIWYKAMMDSERAYFDLLANGSTAQEARSVLPNSLKTEVVMTANFREWRHFFKLRAAGITGTPHPQMSEIAVPLFNEVRAWMPEMFSDIWLPGEVQKKIF